MIEFVYLAYMIVCIAWMVAMFDFKGWAFVVYLIGFIVYCLQFLPASVWG